MDKDKEIANLKQLIDLQNDAIDSLRMLSAELWQMVRVLSYGEE